LTSNPSSDISPRVSAWGQNESSKEGKMKKLLMILPLALIICYMVGCQDKEAITELEEFKAQAEVEEQNKAIILKWFGELSKDNFEPLYEELFAPDCQQYMPPNAEPMSFKEYKPMAKQVYEAFPEITHTVGDIIAEGDKVAAKILVHTIHEGEFFGMPATGKELEWTAIAIFLISDGKIKVRWEIADIMGLYQQLGMELKPKE
jgi:steroid delta-isomerase-like uncharacterized protein